MTQPTSAHGNSARLAKLLAMVEKDPHDAFCLYGVAQEYAKSGQHDCALEWYDKSIAADPNGAYSYFHKARSQVGLGRNQAAVETLKLGAAAALRGGDMHAKSEIDGFLQELGAPESS